MRVAASCFRARRELHDKAIQAAIIALQLRRVGRVAMLIQVRHSTKRRAGGAAGAEHGMLQIITEKFFKPGERYTTLHRAIFYTNYRMMRGEKMETPVGALLPSTGLHSLATLTCEMTEQQEKYPDGPKPGIFIATSGDELLNDFAAVISFVLNVTCTPDPDLTRRLLSTERPSLGMEAVPSQFIRRMFDKDVHGREGESAALSHFVGQLIGLERQSFVGAMRAIRQFITGSHRIADDLSLAYALFVMSIESLAQKFDGHVAEWSDYEERKRTRIDKALIDIPAEGGDRVRSAVLANEHVATARRFRDFAMAHVAPSFFRKEATDVHGPLSRADLANALRQAYAIRSAYVHTLHDIPRQLTIRGFLETMEVDDQPTLSFAGLSRLARHIIMQFVARGRTVDHEEFDYRRALPGIVTVPLSPEYWVAATGGFDHESARSRLSGFLSQLTDVVLLGRKDAKLTDLRPILKKVEELLPGLINPAQRLPMLTLYFLFHQWAPREYHCEQWPTLFQTYENDFELPSVESLVAHLMTQQKPNWSLEQFEELHRSFFRLRHTAKAIDIGRLLEAAFSLYLAEMNRAAGNEARARDLIAFAVEVHPSCAALREFEASLSASGLLEIDWLKILLPRPAIPSQDTDAPKR